ncbi:hypothetical protein RAS1_00920 [Phycisphaerae bacterium RAS1]|nr:hypothetical protein RAS1_00920 [Phycisphaerae bacterium RAS1]
MKRNTSGSTIAFWISILTAAGSRGDSLAQLHGDGLHTHSGGLAGLSEFVPGRVYAVSVGDRKSCGMGGLEPDSLWEIDPATGAFRSIGYPGGCQGLGGAAFRPDGKAIRLTRYHRSDVLEMTPGGQSSVLYDLDDGIGGPQGSSSVAYDSDGNFYVSNFNADNIVRFPVDGGPSEVFTSSVGMSGSIAFAASGDLFWAGQTFIPNIRGQIMRARPDGSLSIFDVFPSSSIVKSVTTDRFGNVFAYTTDNLGTLYRYSNEDPTTRQVLVSNFGFDVALTMSADHSLVYLGKGGFLYSADPSTGNPLLIGHREGVRIDGLAVFVPEPWTATLVSILVVLAFPRTRAQDARAATRRLVGSCTTGVSSGATSRCPDAPESK